MKLLFLCCYILILTNKNFKTYSGSSRIMKDEIMKVRHTITDKISVEDYV